MRGAPVKRWPLGDQLRQGGARAPPFKPGQGSSVPWTPDQGRGPQTVLRRRSVEPMNEISQRLHRSPGTAPLLWTRSRFPSGPAAAMPRATAGHMSAVDPDRRILRRPILANRGPSTHEICPLVPEWAGPTQTIMSDDRPLPLPHQNEWLQGPLQSSCEADRWASRRVSGRSPEAGLCGIRPARYLNSDAAGMPGGRHRGR
jgi:hypothetical protein